MILGELKSRWGDGIDIAEDSCSQNHRQRNNYIAMPERVMVGNERRDKKSLGITVDWDGQ